MLNEHGLVMLFQAAKQMKRLYELFVKVDATQVEINPFFTFSPILIFLENILLKVAEKISKKSVKEKC